MQTVSCCAVAKSVLDELYVLIPGMSAAKDRAIADALKRLSYKYRHLSTEYVSVDYADPAVRFAYIFRYVISHANMVCDLVGASPELQELFRRSKVQIACLGGGPGTDVLGVLKYLLGVGTQTAVKCWLYDKEQAWGECWSNVDDKVPEGIKLSTYFEPVDVTLAHTWQSKAKYYQCDLFSAIYFVSEMFWFRNEAQPFFVNLFDNAKAGSLFLYVDNGDDQFAGWYDKMVAACGLTVIASARRRMTLGGK